MAALLHLRLTDKLACQASPVTYGLLRPQDLVEARDVRAVDDEQQLTIQFTRVGEDGAVRPIVAQLRAGRILTARFADETFDEWRIASVDDGRGTGGLVTVQAHAIERDLADRADSTAGKGWVSSVVHGIRNFDVTITDQTPTQIWDTYVIPNCPAWVARGTVTPAVVIPSLTMARATPWALAVAVRDAVRAQGVDCELDLRRNGTTDYRLDLVTAIGAGAAVPCLHPQNGLLRSPRNTDPTDQVTRVLVVGANAPDGRPGILGRARWRGGAPSGLTLTLTDGNGGPGPIGFDGQWVGAYLLRVATGRTFLITASNADASSVTLAAIGSIGADEDFEFRLTEPLTNTRTSGVRYAITAVSAGELTCASTHPIAVDGQYREWYARVWSAASAGTVVATTRITGATAATDAIAVASTVGVTTSHHVEFVQLDGAGEVPSFVDHPTYAAADPVGYGVKCAELPATAIGVVQLIPNGWMRSWSVSTVPDGYVKTGAGTLGATTDPLYTVYGGKAARADWSGVALQSPPIYPTIGPGTNLLSLRARVIFETMTAVGGDFVFTVALRARTASGGLGDVLASTSVRPGDSAATDFPKVPADAWAVMEIVSLELGAVPFGVVATVVCTAPGADQCVGAIDTLEAYGFAGLPDAAYEFGDASALLQAGNRVLRLRAAPPVSYDMGVLDLARALGADYARLTLVRGGALRAVDPEYGLDVTVRVLRLERDLLRPMQTTLTLGNRSAQLSEGMSVDAAGGAPAVTPPWLDVIPTPGSTTYTIQWRGGDVVTLARDGNGYGAPPASPFTVERAPAGGATQVLSFRAQKGGRIVPAIVTVPPCEPVVSETLVPQILTLVTANTIFPGDGGGSVDISWTGINMPSGVTYALTYKVTIGNTSGPDTATVSGITSPYTLSHPLGATPPEGRLTLQAFVDGIAIATAVYEGAFAY